MRRLNRRARGLVLYALLGVVLVTGLLTVALDARARHRNRLAHRAAWARVADGLAAAALENATRHLRRGFAAGASAARPPAPDSLGEVMLRPAGELAAGLARRDAAAWMREWFGDDWDFPVRELAATHPGARVALGWSVTAAPLHDGAFRDPLEKRGAFTLRAEARYRGVARATSRRYPFKVVHPMPPVTSKFSLFIADTPGGDREYNTFLNAADGAASGDRFQAPFVVQSTPVGDPSDREFMAANAPNLPDESDRVGDPWADQDRLRALLDDRGWIYMGAGGGGPIRLNLTAGGARFEPDGTPVPGEAGEFFHLYDPVHRGSQPAAFYLLPAHVPPPFRRGQTGADGVTTLPLIQYLYWGYESSGAALTDAGLDAVLGDPRSSVLHLFGDDDVPSRAWVFGPVRQRFPRIAYLGVDRAPGEDDDEAVQARTAAAAGVTRGFPRRDALGPIFVHVDAAATWDAELAREDAGEPTRVLKPIPHRDSGLPAPVNTNFIGASRPGGPKDTIFDFGHPTVPLDPGVYRYRKLFPGGFGRRGADHGGGYARYMSDVIDRPMHQVVDMMMYSGVFPPERHPAFPGWTARDPAALEAGRARVAFGDPTHAAAGAPPAFDGPLAELFSGGDFAAAVRARAAARLPDAAAFFARFEPRVSPALPGDDTPVLFLDEVVVIEEGPLTLDGLRVYGAGAVVLETGDLTVGELRPVHQSIPSLVALDGDLRLTGASPKVGFFAAPRGELINVDGVRQVIRGGVAVDRLPAEALESGGRLTYDASGDPTRVPAAGPAYGDYYRLALAPAPDAWGRVR